jgi:hypothetical protein
MSSEAYILIHNILRAAAWKWQYPVYRCWLAVEVSSVFWVLQVVDAGSNTSTVTLRVVGGDEKGSLESETVKYGHESHGTTTRK